MSELALFATAPQGVEPLLAAELSALGAGSVQERRGGVAFSGELACAYRACLESRLANRILLPLLSCALPSADALYEAALQYAWEELFAAERSFAIHVTGHSPAVAHTNFAALRLKDAVADRFRENAGVRPSVDTAAPDILLNLKLDREHAHVALDLSGESLHRRGYRHEGAGAPLKENLAAAILVRAGWPRIAAAGGALLDPMCGSGTLVIEAALMAAGIAPGLARRRFGFEAWSGHDAALWQDLRRDAAARCRDEGLPIMAGLDRDPRALAAARDNARRAGVAALVTFGEGDAADCTPPAETGLVVTNPPYGERLGGEAELVMLYSLFGAALRERFGGWRAALFTPREDLTPRLGLRAQAMHTLRNGPLTCKLLQFDIARAEGATTDAAPDFENRLRKNLKHLGKWARRSGVRCWRVYDADLPDYALAVDVYEADRLHLHVQEYTPPASVDPVRAQRRLRAALATLRKVFDLPSECLHFKQRARQRGDAQYQRQAESGRFLIVDEHGCRLRVNLDDYLDTGLFLDHRPLRRRLQTEAAGKRFLNLFCYTGAATVHAAVGGARETVSVDLSNTYLEWARENLALNGIAVAAAGARPVAPTPSRSGRSSHSPAARSPHLLVRADVMGWLADARGSFDLIFCDPPSFSNSRRLDDVFDVQRDHATLLCGAARLLAPGGTLYFSTNRRRFKLDGEALAPLQVEDITAQTVDEDFRRPRPPHRCWRIRNG